jgi:hypothetical protein
MFKKIEEALVNSSFQSAAVANVVTYPQFPVDCIVRAKLSIADMIAHMKFMWPLASDKAQLPSFKNIQ